MKCAYPVRKKRKLNGSDFDYQHACGQCLPCRINQQQSMTARCALDVWAHGGSALFITITYAGNTPTTPAGDETLRKTDLRAFQKRLRKNTGRRIRMFGCGEYGDKYRRPHYHLILWPLTVDYKPDKPWSLTNAQCETLIQTMERRMPRNRWREGYFAIWWRKLTWIERELYRAWPDGEIDVKEAEASAIRYVAGYSLKKLTSKGPAPAGEKEFRTFPNRPAMGVPAARKIAEMLKKYKLYPEDRPDLCPGEDWKPTPLRGMQLHGKAKATADSARAIVQQQTGGVAKRHRPTKQYWPMDRTMKEAICREYGEDKRTDIAKAMTAQFAHNIRMAAFEHGVLTMEMELSESEMQQNESHRRAAIARKSRSF